MKFAFLLVVYFAFASAGCKTLERVGAEKIACEVRCGGPCDRVTDQQRGADPVTFWVCSSKPDCSAPGFGCTWGYRCEDKVCVPIPPTTLPAPSPSPESSPSPLPEASPSPSPTPKPSPSVPLPSPPPCETKPLCVKKDGTPATECVSCAEFQSSGRFTREGDLLFFIGSEGKEYMDPRTCYMVYGPGDLRTRNKRYINDGSVCDVGCSKNPKPCAPPSPQASPSPGAPNPGPTPAACPALVRWGGGLHAQMTPQFQGLPKLPAFAGNTLDFDSTARFGNQAGGRGLPCNDEHHAVCEANGIDNGPNWRRCEDPRGPIFTVTRGGGSKVKTINGGWGLRIEGAHAGQLCVRIQPRDDVQDALGVPVRVLGDAASESCVEVE